MTTSRPLTAEIRARLRGRRRRRDAAHAAAARTRQHAAVQALREGAAEALARGDVDLVVDETPDELYELPTYRLVPHDPCAAPIEVHADSAGIYVRVGPHGSLHEIFAPEVGAAGRQLRECVAAIVAGGYEELYEPCCATGA